MENSAREDLINKIFAIEICLDPLRKRIRDGRVDEALEIVDGVERSIERAKDLLRK